ncbi:MAG: ATP-dependent DNA helicase RecG [Agathobaculum sp.]|uniref:ATP-dependent DNA helicase RecG n=1 Tax=Agathobaculum sp. TaxID=2048138 RepID=UPI0025C185BA|nr:ATP-dependent DNA helicase RecG [Agathobaculum sp.]MCI7126202.1 ATP-dependent DNA helicase RecG [Agathobaculum sp.]
MPALDDSVQFVKGVGPKKAKLLEKLHIATLRDMLETYPRDYEDRSHPVRIADITEEGKYAVRAVVGVEPKVSRIRKGLTLVKCTVFDESGTLAVTYFNNPYAAAQLRVGQEYLFYGRVQGTGRARVLVSPQAEKMAGGEDSPGRIVPVYPLTAGLTQRDMARVAQAALAAVPGEWPDPLPMVLRARYRLPDAAEALGAIHAPRTLDDVTEARRRMVFEELFLLCCGLQQLKERRRGEDGIPFAPVDNGWAFWDALPFAPTGAQRRAIGEICADCASGRPMNRLVQGDVGAGKTVVAAALCALAARSGWQAAFMAPTEILAAQHAETLSALLGKLNLSVTLLTGSMTAAQRRAALAAIETGAAQVVVGTHALIQQSVTFHRLGAVIADEQHRFGVAQRAALAAKGHTPHTLVMSATPIPRTLALIMYGDLDVSVLDETPPGRRPVETYAVGKNMRKRITAFIDKQLEAGGQVYVVCPLVEEGETGLKSAEQHAKDLQAALPHRRVAVLHGRMKNADKERVMRAFAAWEYDVLVATTVIEVGVDVPNANLMVVEDADRFGLSQLHQLRGRVGRGARQSYCVFFGADKGETARARLKTLCRTNDGFEIARADLAQRGPGDFFGRRQHGLPALHVADLAADLALMQSAREEAEAILAADPGLAGYPELRARVQRMFAQRGDEAFN